MKSAGALVESTKSVSAYAELSLFDIPFYVNARVRHTDEDTNVRFTVRVGDKTLGYVLRYIVNMVSPDTEVILDPPWSVLDSISLKSFAFEVEFEKKQTKFGFSYSDIGLDLGFLQIDKLEVFYLPTSEDRSNESVDVNIFGTFFGFDFTREPVSWDALKERPPSTPNGGSKQFRLDYLGLGQRVTLRDIAELKTIEQVMKKLRKSYEEIPEGAANPLGAVPTLTYDNEAAWLVGAQFSVLETFDFAGLWNLPQLAGARIGLRGERAKSLAGFEFEILYRRIADNLGQYHIELVLPDVLRRFQAGIVSVTLPIITVDIYTDGGFLIDLGFPHELDFSRSFSIEMLVMGIPVTGGIGVYFGALSEKAVPAIPEVTGGSFKPVIVAGVGLRIGVGKSITVGILDAGLFIGIETLLEGILGFYEPLAETEPKATFFRVTGTLQLTAHIWGEVNFAIIKAKVDIYACISVQGAFEAYRASLVAFEAGVRLKLTVKIAFISIKLSFGVTIRHEVTIGQDELTPWRLAAKTGSRLIDRIGPVAYRRLPTGEIIADAAFAQLLEADRSSLAARPRAVDPARWRIPLKLYFHPATTIGVAGDHPGATHDEPGTGCVQNVALLLARLRREENEKLAPAEAFVAAALEWGLAQVRHQVQLFGADLVEGEVRLSELRWLADDLVSADPCLPIDKAAMMEFLKEFVEIELCHAAEPRAGESEELTPFPMLPYMTLETSGGHIADFETEPECSVAYQKFITDYFDQLNQSDAAESEGSAIRSAEQESLSMATLIFVDTFRIVLRSVVDAAIETLRLLEREAAGATLMEVARRCGLDSPAGLLRISHANTKSKTLYAIDSPIYIVARGVPLAEVAGLDALADAFNLPLLPAARHLREQHVLEPGSTLRVVGGRYRIETHDTRASILEKFGIPDWAAVEAANPFFDWSVPEIPMLPLQPPGADPLNRWPYPILALPAGETIQLPVVEHTVAATDTLQRVADDFGTTLFELVSEESVQPVALTSKGLAWRCAELYVRQGETLGALAERAGLASGPEDETGIRLIYPMLKDNPDILVTGSTLAIPAGRYIFKRGDTLTAMADRFQTTREAIVEANSDSTDTGWKFIPRPGSDEELPLGVEIVLPPVGAYRVSDGETFASIAKLFWLVNPIALAQQNADCVLQALTAVILPPLRREIPEPGESAEALAIPFGIDPVEFVLANRGADAGQGSDVQLDKVLVPDCELIEESELIDLLAGEGTDDSELAATASSLARFLLAGLRLPSPADFEARAAQFTPVELDIPLYPLYELTGQQWRAPAEPTTADWIELRPNDSPEARESFGKIMKPTNADGDEPVYRFNLSQLDVDLIIGFRAALGAVAIDPIVHSRYPALQQVAVERAFGTATPWAKPGPLTFLKETEETAAEQNLILLAVPRTLRAALPTVHGQERLLQVLEGVSDPVSGKAQWHEVGDVGWATRLDVQIRRVLACDGTEEAMPAAYEVLSASAQSQADLVGLRRYLEDQDKADGDDKLEVDLEVLFPSGARSALAGSMCSDQLTQEDRDAVSLLKSNLSTFSRPPTLAAMQDPGNVIAAATLAQPRELLELLWQVSVTNAGGFFLHYGVPLDDPGLPEELFESSESAIISVLAILRPKGTRPTISGRCFHNVLVCAQNLASDASTLVAKAKRHVVTDLPKSPGHTESLAKIAGDYGTTAAELGVLNASTENVLKVNVTVRYTPPEGEPRHYTTVLGDDLLTVALALRVEVAELAASQADNTDLLHSGAQLEVYPDWVASRNRVEQPLGGFRVLRREPAEIVDGDDLQVTARIERLFNLLGYSLRENDNFHGSAQGLPIPPSEPDDQIPNGLFAVADGDSQPWVYSRLLPIAVSAKHQMEGALDSPDPYAGLSHKASIQMRFHDTFGNLFPGAQPPLVEWEQLYRDPLIPVHAWPSVTIAYDVLQRESAHAPDLSTRIKFAPAGYVSTPGTTLATLREQALADRDRFALAYYQLVDWRVSVTVTTSLRPALPEIVSTEALSRFTRDAYIYLTAIAQLGAVCHAVKATDKLETVAGEYQLTTADLARHIAKDRCALAIGAEVHVPLLHQVMPNVSIIDILEEYAPENVPAEKLGVLNEKVPLTPGIWVHIGDALEEIPSDATLRTLATEKIGPGDIAKANRQVKGLFQEGEILSFGVALHEIAKGDTLASIAQGHELIFEVLAASNAKTRILREGAALEIPLHRRVCQDSPCHVVVREGESIRQLTNRIRGAVRDVLTANADTVDLLAVTDPPQEMVYAKQATDGGVTPSRYKQFVGPNDTLATVTSRFARQVDDPSLRPADVGAFEENAVNKTLLNPGALMLEPPRRVIVPLSVPPDGTHSITIAPLEVRINIVREIPDTIEPAFRNSPEVVRVSSEISPRLSSAHSPDDRATLVAFARRFQSVFKHLRLATGPDTLSTDLPTDVHEDALGQRARLMMVQWDPSVLHATVHGPACFFAPKPLSTELWSGKHIPIFDYVPGQPLDPPEGSVEPTLTNFTGVDLERWAEQLLRRIDALLRPKLAISLRDLAPSEFQLLINSKQQIALAVADRISLVLPVEETGAPRPDVASARDTYLKQILVELGETYRGGVVVQYEAEVVAPEAVAGQWTPATAPRFLCNVEPASTAIPATNPTLDGLAELFDAPVLIIAMILEHTENLLFVGKTVPVGPRPTIGQQDRLASIAERAGVTLEVLVEKMHDKKDFLNPKAGILLVHTHHVVEPDDTFASVLEHLAPNLTSRGLLDTAIRILDALNGDQPGVFIPGEKLERTPNTHTTGPCDTLRSVASALGYGRDVVDFVCDFYVCAPLLAEKQIFRYLAFYPPSTTSPAKIALFSGGPTHSKFNVIYTTTAPDEASMASIKLAYAVQALEYNIKNVGEKQEDSALEYQTSDWLTFIDWEHGEDLGEVQIPIPNRQFAVPPAVLSHDTIPQVADGTADPEQLEALTKYDYVLSFAFDAAAQDDLYYEPTYNVAPPAKATKADDETTALAPLLAQFAAVDTPLWEDLLKLRDLKGADEAIVLNAVQVFTKLAKSIACAWKTWAPSPVNELGDSAYLIRRHRHPDGRSHVTMQSVSGNLKARRQISARLLGRKARICSHNGVQHAIMTEPRPVPRTRFGEKYEIKDPGLSVLDKQNVWGRIRVKRNDRLVPGRSTNPDFVLQICDVRAQQPATPMITITQKLPVAGELGPLAVRLTRLLDRLLFSSESCRGTQLASLTTSFTRPLVEVKAGAATLDPADDTSLFAPVIATPALSVTLPGAEKGVDTQAIAKQISEYLIDTWLAGRRLTPLEHWSFTLRLFSEVAGDATQPPLMELVDLRVPMETA